MCFGDERRQDRESMGEEHADIRQLFDRYRAYARRAPRVIEDDEPLELFDEPSPDREPVLH